MSAIDTTTNSIVNLWPEDFGTPDEVPPVVILKQQATMLGQRTQNILIGDVASGSTEPDTIYHNFYIVAPALGNYRYKLCWLSQKVTSLYPVWLSDREQPLENAEALLEALRILFSSEKTTKVVQSLLAQSKSSNMR